MSWNGYNIIGWPHNPQQVETMLDALVKLYPDVQPRTITKPSGRFVSHESAAVSAAFHDDVIDATEMEIAHGYIEDGVVLGQKEWDAMTPAERSERAKHCLAERSRLFHYCGIG